MKLVFLSWCAIVSLALLVLFGMVTSGREQPPDLGREANLVGSPFLLSRPIESRSISFENPTGERGNGGKARSNLGVGRKGRPSRRIRPGKSVVLGDVKGPGVIRHIWMTTADEPENLRSLVVRAWWDGQRHPSIESPLGDFMGFAHGRVRAYESAVHSVGEKAGMNIWLAMPFRSRARMTLTNQGREDAILFYQIDYTVGDLLPEDVGRLHVLFRRENPTTLGRDFELLPQRSGKGRFIGSVMGVRSLGPHWWGEGEMKVFLDGDSEFPTIAGTGAEDYVGLSWGMQQTPFRFNGCSLNEEGYVSMYRWHLPDPIYWWEEIRITIQQIGKKGGGKKGLAERQDDWSSASFWYEPVPSAPLPAMPKLAARIRDLGTNPD